MARGEPDVRQGVSLAKGPVGILGLVGILYGLSALLFSSHGFALHFPTGAVHGKKWIGLEVNGWSELLFIAAGLVLLLAAPLHWGAKSMSLIVGGVLLAAAIIAVIRGNGVFGIFAANHLTEVVWAAAGVLLLVLALLPRVGGGRAHAHQSSGSTREAEHASRVSSEVDESEGHPRRLVRRPRDSPDTDDSDRAAADEQHRRWLQEAEPQDRPPIPGAQRTDDNPSR